MQFVKTADLKPGMRLAKPIYNKMGVLLYERDTLLTMQGINSIENFGLIGIFILEPAEPVPPLSREDLEFEQFQTIYFFKLKEDAKDQVDSLTNEKQGLESDLSRLNGQLNTITSDMNQLEQQAAQKEDEINTAAVDLKRSEERSAEQYEDMKVRIQYSSQDSSQKIVSHAVPFG